MRTYQRVLALGAHTDDIELGCGAALSRLAREGVEIRVAAFSRAEKSLHDGAAEDTLEREFHAAMAHLSLPEHSIYTGRIPVREFSDFRQDILEELVEMNRSYDPDLIFTMNSRDTHQDHEVMHAESVRAFRHKTILGYEIPWNQRESVTNLFFGVTADDVECKAAMLAEYKSQQQLKRGYTEADFVWSAATFRGFQSRKPFAEAYEVITMNWDS